MTDIRERTMKHEINQYGHIFVLARSHAEYGSPAEILGAFSTQKLAVQRMLETVNDNDSADYQYAIQCCYLNRKLGAEFDADSILEGALAERNRSQND